MLCLTLSLLVALGAPPTVFWASDPVAPGETVLVTGDGFAGQPQIELTRLPDSPAAAPSDRAIAWPEVVAHPVALQPTGSSLKFAIPATSKPGVYAWRIDGRVGWLNRPVVYWLQGDSGPGASPGGWLRLFGRNLGWPAAAGASTKVRLVGPTTLTLAAVADTWAAKAELPPTLPAGDYTVWLHNGCGGDQAWGAPLKLTVAAVKPWPTRVVNVRDTGAAGTGEGDDGPAIQQALDQAGAAGGGVVLLPRGRYRVTDTLTIPRFVTLRGEGMDKTALCWPDSPQPPEALLLGTNSFAVEELTVYVSYHRHIIVGDTGDKPDSGNVRLWRVRVRADSFRGHLEAKDVDQRFRDQERIVGGDSIRVGGPNVEIAECDIYGSGRALYLMRVRGGRIHDNHFYNGRWGWYCISGSDGLIFERNQLAGADLMSTGGGLNCLDGSTFSQNVYYADCDLRHMNGWDRESMTSDAGGGPYLGHVASSSGADLVLAAPVKWDHDWSGAGVFVLDGKGRGQVRRVAKHNGQTVTLDRPLDVAADPTSVLSITQYQGHYLMLRNHFADCGAMQFYGTAIENVVAGNVGERMQGFHAWALRYDGYQPVIHTQLLGNELRESYYHWSSADDSFIGLSGAQAGDYHGPMNLGSVIRGNRLRSNAMIRVQGQVQGALVEGNDLRDCDRGIFVSGTCQSVLVTGNHFTNVAHELLDEEALRQAALERMRRFMGQPEPIAAWDFEQQTKGKYPDSSRNRFAAVAVGGVKPVDGHLGKGVELDGTGYLRIDETAAFNVPDVTVTLWVKPTLLSGRRGLVAKRFGGTGCPFVLSQMGAAVGFEAASENGTWPFNFGGPAVLKAGTWTHVAMVVRQDRGITLYADGKQVAEKLVTGPRSANGEPLILGREAWGGDPPKGDTPGFFVGALDEVRVWGRALSAAEVVADAAR